MAFLAPGSPGGLAGPPVPVSMAAGAVFHLETLFLFPPEPSGQPSPGSQSPFCPQFTPPSPQSVMLRVDLQTPRGAAGMIFWLREKAPSAVPFWKGCPVGGVASSLGTDAEQCPDETLMRRKPGQARRAGCRGPSPSVCSELPGLSGETGPGSPQEAAKCP